MTEQYIVAHKSRGELVLDCVVKLDFQIAGEDVWITNTGQRVYPFWARPISTLDLQVPDLPSGLRDQFEVTEAMRAPKKKVNIEEIDLSELGL